MNAEEGHSGIPTRAIHDGYLDMQRALSDYREAKDKQRGGDLDRAHGEVQSTVLTFYELLRPHLKHNQAVTAWWDGEVPDYPGDGSEPDPEDGKGVLQVQTNHQTVALDRGQLERLDSDDAPETLAGWHDFLDMADTVRLTGIRGLGEGVLAVVQQYQLGLRHLDDWGTEFKTVQTELDGFYGSKTRETVERQRVDMPRLRRAARELSDVAERLGALSEFDPNTEGRTQITKETMDRVEQWQQQQTQ